MPVKWKSEWEIEILNPWTVRAKCPSCRSTTMPCNVRYYQNCVAGRVTRCPVCGHLSFAPKIEN